jgi:hypothetical protein
VLRSDVSRIFSVRTLPTLKKHFKYSTQINPAQSRSAPRKRKSCQRHTLGTKKFHCSAKSPANFSHPPHDFAKLVFFHSRSFDSQFSQRACMKRGAVNVLLSSTKKPPAGGFDTQGTTNQQQI